MSLLYVCADYIKQRGSVATFVERAACTISNMSFFIILVIYHNNGFEGRNLFMLNQLLTIAYILLLV